MIAAQALRVLFLDLRVEVFRSVLGRVHVKLQPLITEEDQGMAAPALCSSRQNSPATSLCLPMQLQGLV
jgi:hypothetical protein